MTRRTIKERVDDSIRARKSKLSEHTPLQDLQRVVNGIQAAGQSLYYRDEHGQQRRLPENPKLYSCHPQSQDLGLPDQSDDDAICCSRDEIDFKRYASDLDDDSQVSPNFGAASFSEMKTSRKRSSLAMQRSDSHRSVRRFGEDEYEGDCDKSDEVPSFNFCIGDAVALGKFYTWIFSCIQELSLKYILKDWIKELEPKKSRNHPYCNGEKAAPPWWPLCLGVEHREPDHLKKKPRHLLVRCLITYAMDPKFNGQGIDRLRHSTSNTKLKFDTDGQHADVRADRRRECLNQLYDLMDKEFMLRENGIDADERINIRNPTLLSMKDARVNKRGKRIRVKYATSERAFDATLMDGPSTQQSSQDASMNHNRLTTPEHESQYVTPSQLKNEYSLVGFNMAYRQGMPYQPSSNVHCSPRQRSHHMQSSQIPLSQAGPFSANAPGIGPYPFGTLPPPACNIAQAQPVVFPASTMPMSTPALSMGSSSSMSPREQQLMDTSYDLNYMSPSAYCIQQPEAFDQLRTHGYIPGRAPATHMSLQPQPPYDQSYNRFVASAPQPYDQYMSCGQSFGSDHDQRIPFTY